ncbi:MAG: hypothetical protein CVT90_01980 [Candidatus Altiarchaeales archaeon HGW-Altiarchaeales-3]|nr:MAG: hypothetical protein CVT90_01980 [Candidatus Altiarchaeales archaeon HGW-Altiarchaeales-3]
MKKYIPYLIFLISILVFCTLIFTAPYAAYLGEENTTYLTISKFNYNFLHPVCHQKPERSFFIYGHQLGVCARCTGIYIGMLILTLLYPLVRNINNNSTPSKYYLIASLIPIGLDGVTQLIGLRESTNEVRFITGFIFGGILIFYLIPVFNELSKKAYHKFIP